ncbi:hypothetical protein [Nocardiopsis protaetiae]|uniref:hypothetical protein n=1 Tax=Nocardiopsis protaetiae TaxID=3382270 RepID=UPI00387AE812
MALSSGVKRASERLLPTATRTRLEAERREAGAAEAERRRAEKIARKRRELLEADPDLRVQQVDGAELLGRAVTSFTAAGASARNLRLVTDALAHAGIDHFLVRGRSPLRHVVGVHRSDKKRLLDTMRELYGTSALSAIKPGTGGVVAAASAYVDGALDEKVKAGLVIRFAERLLSLGGRELAGFEFGCDVEFWRDGTTILEHEAPRAGGRSCARRPRRRCRPTPGWRRAATGSPTCCRPPRASPPPWSWPSASIRPSSRSRGRRWTR